MKAVVPVLAAGGAFAAAGLVGLAAGIWLGRATGHDLWVVAGLFGGLAAGGYSAVRLLLRSM